jgi:exodeoxyribonuclease VII small subunit
VAEQSPSFEDVYAALEEAVGRLEAGGLPLDDAIAAYEEGMRLARACRTLLDTAELRITTLRDALAEEDLPLPDDDE